MRLFGVSLGEGNAKIGEVFTFSLPSIVTCPGASSWCKKHCYAYRYEKMRPICRQAYQDNLELARVPEAFKARMIGILPRIMPCFRLHVSGDFFARDYADCWTQICLSLPDTRFWGYTRSWSVPDLRDSLERLRDLDNVQIFASVDPTMPLPLGGWRVAFVETDARASGFPCKSQAGESDSCLNCGYCFNPSTGNVIFKVH